MTKQVVKELSIEEMEELLKEKKAEKQREENEKREAYEKERDELIYDLGAVALGLYNDMKSLKRRSMNKLTVFRDKMMEYGDLRGGENNKGSFEIKNERFKIQFSSKVVKKYDERALLAEAKMNEFLTTFVKKRDKKLYDFISSLMKRKEETGEFDHDMISRLYARENDYDDPNWKEAIKLFKESYSPSSTARYIRFSVALPDGGWDQIVLDFAKIKAAK